MWRRNDGYTDLIMQKCGTVGVSINFISHLKLIHTQEVKISTCASSESTKESMQNAIGPVLHASLFSHSFAFAISWYS